MTNPTTPAARAEATARYTIATSIAAFVEGAEWARAALAAPLAEPADLIAEAVSHSGKCRTWAAKTFNDAPDAALCVGAGDRLLYAAQLLDSLALRAAPQPVAAVPAPAEPTVTSDMLRAALDELGRQQNIVPNPRAMHYALQAALAAAPKAPAVPAPQWMPIDSAPGETEVLVSAEFDRPGDWRIKTGYLSLDTGKWKVWGATWTPTRWMPLPEAPKEQA